VVLGNIGWAGLFKLKIYLGTVMSLTMNCLLGKDLSMRGVTSG